MVPLYSCSVANCGDELEIFGGHFFAAKTQPFLHTNVWKWILVQLSSIFFLATQQHHLRGCFPLVAPQGERKPIDVTNDVECVARWKRSHVCSPVRVTSVCQCEAHQVRCGTFKSKLVFRSHSCTELGSSIFWRRRLVRLTTTIQ